MLSADLPNSTVSFKRNGKKKNIQIYFYVTRKKLQRLSTALPDYIQTNVSNDQGVRDIRDLKEQDQSEK